MRKLELKMESNKYLDDELVEMLELNKWYDYIIINIIDDD